MLQKSSRPSAEGPSTATYGAELGCACPWALKGSRCDADPEGPGQPQAAVRGLGVRSFIFLVCRCNSLMSVATAFLPLNSSHCYILLQTVVGGESFPLERRKCL